MYLSPSMIPSLVGFLLLAASVHATAIASLDSGLQAICEWVEHKHWVEGRCLDAGEYMDYLRLRYHSNNIWEWGQ